MFEHLKNRKVGVLGNELYKEFAVIVPYLEDKDSFLFEIRASTLRNQPNEICFPGGKIENQETPLVAALREIEEELLIDRNNVDVIASLDIYTFPYSLRVYPFLAKLKEYPVTFQKDEVADIFDVPFRFFLENEPKIYYNDIKIEPDSKFPYELIGMDSYPWRHAKYPVLFYEYQNKVIWGMTAHFVYNVVTLCKENQ